MNYDWQNDKKRTDICRSIGSYPLIPSYDGEGNLQQTRKEFAVNSVLDLGCGRGNILDYALSAGIERADGVEYFQSHILAARRRLKKFDKSRYKIYQGDIRTWKPKRKYDLIYIFDPINQEESRKSFFDNLLEWLPDEQLIFYLAADPTRTHKLLSDHFAHASEKSDFPLFKFYPDSVAGRNKFWNDK